jgi:hypothetical protein
VSREPENPDPTLFAQDPGTGIWTARVSLDQCLRLANVTTRAEYQGARCQVVSIAPNGDVGLYYLGDDKSDAKAKGFVQVDPGTWAKTVNIYDLYSFHEHHADLLYERWWRRHHPG